MTNKNIGISLISGGFILLVIGIFTFIGGSSEPQKSQQTKVSLQAAKASSTNEVIEKKKQGLSSTEKGEQFEEYIIKKFDFSRNSLKLLSRTESTQAKSRADLLIELTTQKAKYNIAVECTWRSEASAAAFEWTKEGTLNKMLASAKKDKATLFLLLGEGGKPSHPNDLYIIPITNANQFTIQNLTIYRCNNLSGKFFYDGPSKKLTIK